MPDPSRGAKRGRAAAAAEAPLDAAWADLEAAHAAFAPFRDAALDKWHRRTVLSSGNAALKGAAGLRALAQPVSAQVATLLRDSTKVRTRAQLPGALVQRPLCTSEEAWAERRRAGGEGGAAADDDDSAPEAAWRDAESYDDNEYYTTLLRELLEAHGGVGGGAAEAAAAALRAPKRRRVVDRRASKARKLRFHVMDKLVGFTAPAERELPPFAEQLFGNLFSS